MTDRHAQNPISIRPPRDDRAWLESYARDTGRPVRAIIVEALARERARQEAGTMDTARAREAGAQLRRRPGDLDRLAGWLMLEMADQLDGVRAAEASDG
jgi:hypothetical protein